MNLIVTSDWHIRASIPENRIDNFLQAQEEKIKFILKKSIEHKAPIIVAGDIGDKPKWENWLLRKYISMFKSHQEKIYVLPGQHDLPDHRLDQLNQSALGVLVASKAVVPLLRELVISDCLIVPFPFGKKIKSYHCSIKNKKSIAIIHTLVSRTKLWSKQENFISAKNLLKKNNYDFIISGDNHQSFYECYKDKTLINPGSLMRTTIGQQDHLPRCYLINLTKGSIQKIFIPIKSLDVVFNIEKVKNKNENDKRIKAFVNSLDCDLEFKIKFKENLKKFFSKNKTNKKIKNKIFACLENKGEKTNEGT